MDILIYSNVENLVLAESQPEIIRPLTILKEYTFIDSNISALKLVFMLCAKLQL